MDVVLRRGNTGLTAAVLVETVLVFEMGIKGETSDTRPMR
jgi:hypothetical protein